MKENKKLNTVILVLMLIGSLYLILNTGNIFKPELVNEEVPKIIPPEIPQYVVIDETYVSIESTFIEINESKDQVDIRINMSSNKSIDINIHENYYKVNNYNETTHYDSKQIFNGTINEDITILVQRPIDHCARNYTHIEQVITSGDYKRTITTDLRYLWYTLIEQSDEGYDMFYLRVDTRRDI